jgi:hypothetical protein
MQLITIKHQQSSLEHTSYYVLDKEYSTPEIMNFLFGLTDDDFSKHQEEAYWDTEDTLVWVHGTKAITEHQYQVLKELINIPVLKI